MSEAVVYEQLDQEAQPTAAPHAQAGPAGNGVHSGTGSHESTDLRRLSDVPMELSVEIGRTRMTVGETLQLRAGSIVKLERLAGEPVDLLVNGTPIARGEVVIVDEEFGLRVTEIVAGNTTAPGLGEPDDGGAPDLGERNGGGVGVGGDPIDATPPIPAPAEPSPAHPAVQE
jgi:flagellar motor switch protein FliN